MGCRYQTSGRGLQLRPTSRKSSKGTAGEAVWCRVARCDELEKATGRYGKKESTWGARPYAQSCCSERHARLVTIREPSVATAYVWRGSPTVNQPEEPVLEQRAPKRHLVWQRDHHVRQLARQSNRKPAATDQGTSEIGHEGLKLSSDEFKEEQVRHGSLRWAPVKWHDTVIDRRWLPKVAGGHARRREIEVNKFT